MWPKWANYVIVILPGEYKLYSYRNVVKYIFYNWEGFEMKAFVLQSPYITDNKLHICYSNDLIANLKKTISWIISHLLVYMSFQFVAHPNCQQHLTNIWYGPEMGFMQSMQLGQKILMYSIIVPLVPLFCLVYVFSPDSKVSLYRLLVFWIFIYCFCNIFIITFITITIRNKMFTRRNLIFLCASP